MNLRFDRLNPRAVFFHKHVWPLISPAGCADNQQRRAQMQGVRLWSDRISAVEMKLNHQEKKLFLIKARGLKLSPLSISPFLL